MKREVYKHLFMRVSEHALCFKKKLRHFHFCKSLVSVDRC